MSGNSISSIISLQLSFASKLKNLSLHNNKIIRVDGLEGLMNLEQLYLNHNSIKELEPSSFSGLQKLQILHMGDNALKTLVHLGSLLALVSLDMTSNLLTPSRLGGLSSIDNLSPLPNLAKLWLTNNPISRQNNYRIAVISRLKHLRQLDGRDVTEVFHPVSSPNRRTY
jgi:protein phosphatase 1 regulatory subunit 7